MHVASAAAPIVGSTRQRRYPWSLAGDVTVFPSTGRSFRLLGLALGMVSGCATVPAEPRPDLILTNARILTGAHAMTPGDVADRRKTAAIENGSILIQNDRRPGPRRATPRFESERPGGAHPGRRRGDRASGVRRCSYPFAREEPGRDERTRARCVHRNDTPRDSAGKPGGGRHHDGLDGRLLAPHPDGSGTAARGLAYRASSARDGARLRGTGRAPGRDDAGETPGAARSWPSRSRIRLWRRTGRARSPKRE